MSKASTCSPQWTRRTTPAHTRPRIGRESSGCVTGAGRGECRGELPIPREGADSIGEIPRMSRLDMEGREGAVCTRDSRNIETLPKVLESTRWHSGTVQ